MLDALAPLFLEFLAKCQIGGRAGIGHLSSIQIQPILDGHPSPHNLRKLGAIPV
jgi:hypothetical protein